MLNSRTATFAILLATVGPVTAWLYLKWTDYRGRRDAVRQRLLRVVDGAY